MHKSTINIYFSSTASQYHQNKRKTSRPTALHIGDHFGDDLPSQSLDWCKTPRLHNQQPCM